MWKILCKNILALYRYGDFGIGIFYFASPCMCMLMQQFINLSGFHKLEFIICWLYWYFQVVHKNSPCEF